MSSVRLKRQKQNRRIRALQTKSQQSRFEELEDAVGSVELLCRGLMGVLEKKGLCDREEFMAICRELDAADGSKDGKPLPESD